MMTETPAATDLAEDRTAHETKFIGKLAERLSDDSGKAAVLRRCAGKPLGTLRVPAWFYGLLSTQPIARYRDGVYKNEETYFLVATLFAFDSRAFERIGDTSELIGDRGDDLGATLHRLKRKVCKSDESKSTLDGRFNILLDAEFDPATGGELAYRLRHWVKRIIAMKDPQVRVNWPQLLYDIKRWNSDRKRIQKKWARSYYAPSIQPQHETTTISDTEE